MTNPYTFTDNPTESGVAVCNTDILNDDIMYLKWELSNSPAANTDLSNLTSTGVNNLVQYANELDWDNEIVITTSSMSGVGEYSVPSDGVVIACAIGNGATSNSKRIVAGFFRDNTGTETGGSNVLPYTHLFTSAAFSHFATTEYFTYMEGDTCYYYARAEGFTKNYVRVSFIPFKKTI